MNDSGGGGTLPGMMGIDRCLPAKTLVGELRRRIVMRPAAFPDLRACTRLLLAALLVLAGAGIARGQTTGTVVEYYHLDATGSVRAVTFSDHRQPRYHDYTPFGEEINVTFPTPDRKLFTGQERDFDTALDYFGARYYRASIGQFTTVDPISITPERLRNPQRLNRYAYAINNPLRYVDPKGLDIITYDQQGKQVDRVKQGKWHNFWYGDTYNLSAGGATYNLEGPLKALPNGSSYEVVNEQLTMGMIGGFVRANSATVSSGANLETVLHNSPTGQAWDFKNLALTADQRRLMLFEWGGSLHRADYVGNMAWAYIMASNGYSETFAKTGAGLFQTYEAVLGRTGFGTGWFGDDPRDTKAIAAGYQLWNRVLFGY